ncbi:MAG TPA: Asp23/Gls24 family envelope stress response protein [Ruminococcaceae bacterium]|nr:Asp23/Gls24 family envelope stress response protein [Oscillospiraceae bacterium]
MDERAKNGGGLVISEDVIVKIASMAATDVKGVAGMAGKPANIRGFIRKTAMPKAVKVSSNEGGTSIDVFIALLHGAKMPAVAEEVQQSVKNAVQNMTGRVVHKVNVFVEDIDLNRSVEE